MGSCLDRLRGRKKNDKDDVDTGPPKRDLTEAEKAILVANTNFTLHEIEEWHAGFLRDCPNGKLNKKQFVREYKKFYPYGAPDEFCEHVFRIFDLDHNGYIDFSEFLMSVNLTSSNKNFKKKLEWIFKLYDIDGNGHIDEKEFKKIITAMFNVLDKNNNEYTDRDDHIKELFRRMDTDNSKSITLDEFVSACCRDQLLVELLAPSA